ncbi:hypothetical protein PR202_ga30436 [Eleusine coracana subsp. coracana]|uniref:Uncharacterized protein n=1 Tax=Eleusine coracana subsp. coracana TaxID=191504 RepID=A0AAV5DMA3_ELECO|nr:hypothetical protein PR202_ga30436 [Eleusine coracana subsp. coracana]
MGWWVDGRHAAVADPARNYMGNFVTYTSKEAGVEVVLAMPLRDVAALVQEAVSAPAYDKRFQELVDWVDEHKPRRYIETAVMGMGSPAMSVTMFSSFRASTWTSGSATPRWRCPRSGRWPGSPPDTCRRAPSRDGTTGH